MRTPVTCATSPPGCGDGRVARPFSEVPLSSVGASQAGTDRRGYFAVGLDNAKYSENVGHALRGCGVFGARFLAVSGVRYRRHPCDTQAAVCHLPLLVVPDLHSVIPYDCVPVAVDLIEGATPLPEYRHPERAFYIFGAEDQTLGARVLAYCRDTVVIPTAGGRCLNLSAAVNVVLYDRVAKRGLRLGLERA